MNIKKQIECYKHITVLELYPIQCRLWSTFCEINRRVNPDSDGHTVIREEIHVAYSHDANQDGRFDSIVDLAVGFWPGITGYEGFYLNNAKDTIEKFKAGFVSGDGQFGKTRWEHQDWALNAGSQIYKKLTTTYGDMADLIQHFESKL